MTFRSIIERKVIFVPEGTVTKHRRAAVIIAITLLSCAVMAVTDGVIEPPYAVKSAVKLVMFIALPILYMTVSHDDDFRRMFVPKKKRLLPALAVGVCVYILIVVGYFVLRGVVDFSAVTDSLASGEGVTRDNFIYVAIYISFVNSFCEEVIFRGLAFGALSCCASGRFAYVFSSVTFAVYHIAIMSGWFSPVIFILLIAGLAVGGLIFDAIDDSADGNGCVYPSWVIHMFANLGINTVGLLLFEII